MNSTTDSSPAAYAPGSDLSRWTCVLLIVVASAMALGRILSVQLVYEPSLSQPWEDDPDHPRRTWPATPPHPMPTFSSNDRSRWAAVRALIDDGTWVIGWHNPHTGKDSGIIFRDGWQSVDKMRNPQTFEYYSTKPPLLTFLVASEYAWLKKLFGWSLIGDQRFSVVRVCLVTFNLLPFVLYLWLLLRLTERWGMTDWGRLFVIAAACFATLVTPFLISLNNHTLATCSVGVAVYAAMRILSLPEVSWRWFVVGGFFAGFTAALELPAVAFATGLAILLLLCFPVRTLLLFVPAALMPVTALLALNYAELGEFNLAYSKFNTEWYQYEGSHWRSHAEYGNEREKPKRGIDWAKNKEDKPTYSFHLLLGHHGWFSLTPIYLLALGGMALGVWRLIRAGSVSDGVSVANASGSLDLIASRQCAELAVATAFLSLVVIGYYIYKSDNYGGWCNGPRWLMWLSPLWLLTLLPIVDRLGQRRWGRVLCLVLLAASVLSAHYWDWNPWRHPWIYNWMDSSGWISY